MINPLGTAQGRVVLTALLCGSLALTAAGCNREPSGEQRQRGSEDRHRHPRLHQPLLGGAAGRCRWPRARSWASRSPCRPAAPRPTPPVRTPRSPRLAAQDYNCFGVVPVNATNVITPLVPVAKKNIPILNLDTQIDADASKAAGVSYASFIGSDNLSAGQQAGQALMADMGGKRRSRRAAGHCGRAERNQPAQGLHRRDAGQAADRRDAARRLRPEPGPHRHRRPAARAPEHHRHLRRERHHGSRCRPSGQERGQDRHGLDHLGRRHHRGAASGQGRHPVRHHQPVPLRRRSDGRPGLREPGRQEVRSRTSRRADQAHRQGQRRQGHSPPSRSRSSRSTTRSPAGSNDGHH